MLRFQLPTERIDYLQLAPPAAGPGLVARWNTGPHLFTVAVFEHPDGPPSWRSADGIQLLSPDGEWMSDFDPNTGAAQITRVGTFGPPVVVHCGRRGEHFWTAVAPGGGAVAMKDEEVVVVLALPDGGPTARVKSGWGVRLRFSPGGRWLIENGKKTIRLFDRVNGYKTFARLPSDYSALVEVADGPTAVTTTVMGGDVVSVWHLPAKAAASSFRVGGRVSALAVSADGRRVLTGDAGGAVTVWDADGTRLRNYDWGVGLPLAVAFARDSTRAAVGGTNCQVVIWDLDD